jgi:hypothetical protein
MRRLPRKSLLLAAMALTLAACGGSSSTKPAANHQVTISWAPNHEAGVNKAGGGYRVIVDGGAPISVPYVSGATAPTSADVTLFTGSHTVTVSAFAALDAQGGATGSQSLPSQSLAVIVP